MMDRWAGRIAVVTGASAGIGAAIARDLVRHGLIVVGIARRKHRVKELADELSGSSGTLYAVKADITKEDEIVAAFGWVQKTLGAVHLMVNSASITTSISILETDTEEWRRMFDVNVFAQGICTREAIKSMKSRAVEKGYIINVNCSTRGLTSQNALFHATRNASSALTEGLWRQLALNKTNVQITNLSCNALEGVRLKLGLGIISEEKTILDAILLILTAPIHLQTGVYRKLGQQRCAGQLDPYSGLVTKVLVKVVTELTLKCAGDICSSFPVLHQLKITK